MNFWQKIKNLAVSGYQAKPVLGHDSGEVNDSGLRLFRQEICDLEHQCELADNGLSVLQRRINNRLAEADALLMLLNRRQTLLMELKNLPSSEEELIKLSEEVQDLKLNRSDLKQQIDLLQQQFTQLELTLKKARRLIVDYGKDMAALEHQGNKQNTAGYSISVLELLSQLHKTREQLAQLLPTIAPIKLADYQRSQTVANDHRNSLTMQ